MRIVGVETLRLATLPNLVFVVLHTDSGVTGLGETYYGAAAVEVVVHETLAPMLLASPMPKSAAEIGAAIDADAFYVGTTGSGVEVRARSAIDIALWDLASRARGVSLATLAGDPQRGDLPVYNTCAGPHYMRDTTGQRSLNWGLPSDGQRHRYDDLWSFLNQADRLADDLLADGISAMKIWPFDSPAEATRGESISASAMAAALAPVRRIRDAVGDRMQILIEMHGLWQPRPAAQILGELEHYDVMWAEDPIPPHRIEELAALRAGCRIPIAAGETVGAMLSISLVRDPDGAPLHFIAQLQVFRGIQVPRPGQIYPDLFAYGSRTRTQNDDSICELHGLLDIMGHKEDGLLFFLPYPG